MSCPVCQSLEHSFEVAKNGYDINFCRQCTVRFVHPFPSAEELSEFYNNYHKSKQYKDKIDSKIRRAKRRISSLGVKGKAKFLDVGCNLGFATEAGRKLGYEAIGIDIDDIAIEQARKNFPECEFHCIKSAEIAAQGKAFDVVYCSEVIEHLTNPISFLKDLHGMMHSRSVLMLTTPDNGHFSLPNDIKKLVEWTGFRPPEHLIYFNKKSLVHIFKSAGFGHVKYCFSFKPSAKIIASI